MSTKTTLALQLSHADLLALEAVAGYNADLIANIVTGMVKQQLDEFKQQGTTVTFYNAEHLDNVQPVSFNAAVNGMVLAMAFTDTAQYTPGGVPSSAVMPRLFQIVGKIDDDYLIMLAGFGSRVLSGQDMNHLKPIFDIEAMQKCPPQFTAVRGQLGEGQLAMFPQVLPHAYMQYDLSASPVYRVPAAAIYGLPEAVSKEFEHYGSGMPQAGGHYTGQRPGGSLGSWDTNNGRKW
jgi:hypothetical protein